MKSLTNDDIVSFAQYYRGKTPLKDDQDNIPLLLNHLHSFIKRREQCSSINDKDHDKNHLQFGEQFDESNSKLCVF